LRAKEHADLCGVSRLVNHDVPWQAIHRVALLHRGSVSSLSGDALRGRECL